MLGRSSYTWVLFAPCKDQSVDATGAITPSISKGSLWIGAGWMRPRNVGGVSGLRWVACCKVDGHTPGPSWCRCGPHLGHPCCAYDCGACACACVLDIGRMFESFQRQCWQGGVVSCVVLQWQGFDRQVCAASRLRPLPESACSITHTSS